MVTHGIRAIVVYNPSDGATAQISKPVAGTFDFSKTSLDLGERHPTGGRPDQADVSACRFDFLDSDGSAANQLEAWRAARTRVSMIAVGHSVCVQWYEADHFNIDRANSTGIAQGRADRYSFSMVREGHGKHAIYQQANLLGHLNGLGVTSWRDDPASAGTADGYTTTGAGTHAWITLTESQSITHNAPDHGIYADIVFPLQLNGYDLKLSADIVEGHTDTSTATVRLEGKTFADSNVNTAETDSAVGRASVSISTSANSMYKIRVLPLLTPTGVTTSDDVVGGYPVLRVDGKTTFVDN